ncbi:uncharacterized protein LOC144153941 [Haemaphysalis longicornis]
MRVSVIRKQVMGARHGLLFLLAVYGLFVANVDAKTFNEFRKELLTFNPATLKPQCKTVFSKCGPKLFSMISVLDNVNKRWKEFESAPCMKQLFADGYPDYSQDCSKDGLYGRGANCLLTEEILDVFGEKDKIKPALQCLLDNAKP